jgi:hypothetical protein
MIDRYIVAECPRCHTLLVADSRYKSKTCPKCNARIPVNELKVVRTARDSREARMIVSEAKARRGGLDGSVNSSSVELASEHRLRGLP